MDVTWVKIEAWHAIADTWAKDSGWFVQTRCGIERPWDGTSIDRLPGGSEEACENCLKLLTREVDASIDEPAPKKSRRAKTET